MNQLSRRTFVQIAAGAAAASAASRIARAQTYPARPVRIVVPAAAGGVADVVARLVARPLSDRLGGPFIIENRAGGGSIIGTESVISAAPDGYTLLLIAGASVIAPLVSRPTLASITTLRPLRASSVYPRCWSLIPQFQRRRFPN
jgi:tripartite-type tricarboxylate transporter receptor subunit TctC